MAFKRFDLLTGILLIIFACLVLAIAYGSISLGGGRSAITGTVGGAAITGMSTFICQDTIGGIKCAEEFYPVLEVACLNNTVEVCTNLCELDRLMVSDDRVCPDYCTKYCLPPDIAQRLKSK